MDKKHLAAAGVCLLSGMALGYWRGYIQGKNTEPGKLKEKTVHSQNLFGRPPAFDREKKTISPPFRKTSSRSSLLDLDVLFSKYNRMTPDQIREEVTKLQAFIEKENIPPEEANTILYSLCYRWGQLSPKQALAYADRITTGMSFIHAAIIRGWVSENPEAAVTYYQENKKDSPRSGSILEIIARGMAHASPDGAVKWLECLEEKDKRHAYPAILTSMAEEHPERFVDFAAKLPLETLDKYNLCPLLAKHWTSCDWESARQWMNTLAAAMKEKAMETALDSLVLQAPDQATQIWKELSGDRQRQMAEHIVRKLADKSAVESLKWISINTDESQALPLVRLVVNYSNSASRELQDYALKMPEGPGKDDIIKQIVHFAASYHARDSFIDCAEKMALTDHISNTDTRRECRQNMIYAWAQENPEQAKKWISTAPEQERNLYREKYEAALQKKKS